MAMRRLSRAILFGLLGLCLIGCASSYRDVQSSLPPAAPDKSRVVFFRESHFFGSAITFGIAIDGKKVGSLGSGSVLIVDHVPGDLQLDADGGFLGAGQNAGMVLKAKPGEEYFIEFGTAPDCNAYQAAAPGQQLLSCIAMAMVPRTARDTDSCGIEWCIGLRDPADALPRIESLSAEKADE
jgi:hypothetical protein